MRANQILYVQLHQFPALALTYVGHLSADFQALGDIPTQIQVPIFKGGISQTVPKREKGGTWQVGIPGAKRSIGGNQPARILMIVVNWHLSSSP